VQPLSCDEAFLDVTGLGDAEAIAAELRAQILAQTGCSASAGIGPNMLLARLATKKAKPDGQCLINPVQVCCLIPLEGCSRPALHCWPRGGQSLLGLQNVLWTVAELEPSHA
jgi:nucleotidyltransferase/DNA polymerase involved in DNA repair